MPPIARHHVRLPAPTRTSARIAEASSSTASRAVAPTAPVHSNPPSFRDALTASASYDAASNSLLTSNAL